MTNEDEVFGHGRAVAADYAVEQEHAEAAALSEMESERKWRADEDEELLKREVNPYLGLFDGPSAVEAELMDRVIVAMDRACRLENSGVPGGAFQLVVPGPASAYYMGQALHAALLFEDFRADPRAVRVAENIGPMFADMLLTFPKHEASFRPLGQMMSAMWEAYFRLGPEELLRRYGLDRNVERDHSPEDPGMPEAAFRALSRSLLEMRFALDALAEYPWRGPEETPAAEPDPLSVESAVDPAPNKWFEPTPVADSVMVDMASTQVIPAEAREKAVEALMGSPVGFPPLILEDEYRELVEREGTQIQCTRCFVLVKTWRGEEEQALELHQGSDECRRRGLA